MQKEHSPKISFIMISARDEYPYMGRPDLHLFEPTLESFKAQTLKSFEWIIVDVHYDERKDYFEDLKLPFAVKHVPAKPNIWLEKELAGVCGQYNKGIVYADGELLFFTGDSYMVLPEFMESMWIHYEQGYFPLAWYCLDLTHHLDAEKVLAQCKNTPIKKGGNIQNVEYREEAPIPYSIVGYEGKPVSLDHRYFVSFEGNSRQIQAVPWEWWFGCSSASLEAMLTINGFDQKFDGDKMLLDCDVGSRLDLIGCGPRLALFREIFLARAVEKTRITRFLGKEQKSNSEMQDVTIKCNKGLIWYSRFFGKYRANSYALMDEDIDWIKNVYCEKYCSMNKFCKENHPWQYPFEHKAGYAGHHSSKRWFNFWKQHQQVFDLREEREKRIAGEQKYAEGTFT